MSEKHWRNTIDWLADFVGGLAERSCESVRLHIRQRGDHPRWIASYDGFYSAPNLVDPLFEFLPSLCVFTIFS